jgi:hypothetical protein
MPIQTGDFVAILPIPNAPASATIDIVQVEHAGNIFIRLVDGRTFAAIGGTGLNTRGYIEKATERHRKAIAGSAATCES